MKKIIFFGIFFGIVILISTTTAIAREVYFHASSVEKMDGRWYGVSVSCYQPEGASNPAWEYLVMGYHGHGDPGDTRQDINNYIASLPELPTTVCTEWAVLDSTWKNFWAPPKGILPIYMPALWAAANQEYKTRSTDKVRKGSYSASITCLAGRWWRLAQAWSGLSRPDRERLPLVFKTLAGFELPENRSCSSEQEWETYRDQWVWFDQDGQLLYP